MPPERRLSNITPLPRQAFLLLSLEGFPEEEVAFILGTDVAETRQLADTAGREMAAEIATDVLIIEDETFIAMDLESLVQESRPQRHRRRPHPFRRRRAGQEQEARA